MRFLSDLHLNLFTVRNSDGTGYLRLQGKEFWLRYGRRIAEKDLCAISKYLKKHDEIVSLNLCYNDIGNTGVLILTNNYLKNQNCLRELNLMHCNLDSKGISVLVQVCESLVLKSLRVNGNKIGNNGGILLATLCGKNEHLQELDIAETDQTVAIIGFFREVLQENSSKKANLRVWDISRLVPMNKYHVVDTFYLTNSLGELLRFNSSLIELHLQKNDLDGHDVQSLLDGLQFNKTLQFLDIGYNRIGDFGIDNISNYLKKRPSLLGLNVAGNGITSKGANALYFCLPFSKIRLLDISKNKIGDDGLVDILRSLRKPYFLRYFFIYGNSIGGDSLRIIERMLMSGVLVQDQIDVKIYTVDNQRRVAYYPSDRYKHKYYHELDLGYPDPVKIVKNKIIIPSKKPKVDFLYYPQFPEIVPETEGDQESSQFEPLSTIPDKETEDESVSFETELTESVEEEYEEETNKMESLSPAAPSKSHLFESKETLENFQQYAFLQKLSLDDVTTELEDADHTSDLAVTWKRSSTIHGLNDGDATTDYSSDSNDSQSGGSKDVLIKTAMI